MCNVSDKLQSLAQKVSLLCASIYMKLVQYMIVFCTSFLGIYIYMGVTNAYNSGDSPFKLDLLKSLELVFMSVSVCKYIPYGSESFKSTTWDCPV